MKKTNKDINNVIINEDIKASSIHIIDENGEFIGALNRDDALKLAEEKNLDLVLVSSLESKSVAKLCRADKYIFEKKQKVKQIKKNSKKTEMKEMKIGLNIDVGDLKTKTKQIQEFLKADKKVKLFMRLRRRQMVESEKGKESIDKIIQELKNVQVEKNISLDRNVISVIIRKSV